MVYCVRLLCSLQLPGDIDLLLPEIFTRRSLTRCPNNAPFIKNIWWGQQVLLIRAHLPLTLLEAANQEWSPLYSNPSIEAVTWTHQSVVYGKLVFWFFVHFIYGKAESQTSI